MKLTVFVDWENLRHEIEKIHRDEAFPQFNENVIDCANAYHIMALIHSFLLKEEELKKIFFYAKILSKRKENTFVAMHGLGGGYHPYNGVGKQRNVTCGCRGNGQPTENHSQWCSEGQQRRGHHRCFRGGRK